MIHFTSRGNTELLTALVHRLRELGIESGDANVELILIGASSLEAAASHLKEMPDAERRKAVVVGLDEYLDYHPQPQPGTYGAFLEEYEILGSMPVELTTNWENFGFVGRMKVADQMKLWYGGPSHSPRYAVLAGLADFPDAAAFLIRLVEQVAHGR